MDTIAGYVVDILKTVGGALALIAVLVLFVGALRSIWSVTLGRAILVLPFHGSEALGVWVSGIFSQELEQVEELWAELKKSIDHEMQIGAMSSSAQLIDSGRSRGSEGTALHKDQIYAPNPADGQAIGQVSFGGTSFSPESIFALLDILRTKLASHTVSGQVDRFGTTVRISATYQEWKRSKTVVISRAIENDEQVPDLIIDVAFQISKIRSKGESTAETWTGYRTFLEGYLHHMRFLNNNGDVYQRDAAVDKYRTSIGAEKNFGLAKYNLGILLYGKYEAAANSEAIEWLRSASESPRLTLRALSLSGLAMALCQQSHRFGFNDRKLIDQALGASAEAIKIAPKLEEAHLARGFALQSSGDSQQAEQAYEKVLGIIQDATKRQNWEAIYRKVPGLSQGRRSVNPLKSVALNNLGYSYLGREGGWGKAKSLFDRSLEANSRNKMAHVNLGLLHQKSEEYELAIADFEAGLEADPHYVNGRNEMGMLYLEMAKSPKTSVSQAAADYYYEQAILCHEQAMSDIDEDESRYRAEVRRRFFMALRRNGFTTKADELERLMRDDEEKAETENAVQGP